MLSFIEQNLDKVKTEEKLMVKLLHQMELMMEPFVSFHEFHNNSFVSILKFLLYVVKANVHVRSICNLISKGTKLKSP